MRLATALALSVTVLGAEERLVSVAPGESLRVLTLGEGQPVVLIPGLFTSAFGFRKLAPQLAAQGCRVAIVEPLGTGGSSRPASADYSLTAQSDRVAAVVRGLGMQGAIVVAHSVGASIALRLAVRHPPLVSAIVSLEGGPAESPVTGGFRRAMLLAPLLRFFGAPRLRSSVQGTLRSRSADPRWVTDEVVDGYMAQGAVDTKATLTAYRRMAKSREPERLASRLRELRCPVWLLLGAAPHEGGIRDTEVEQMRSLVPELHIERVPGAGHFVFEERPDAVAAVVLGVRRRRT